MKSEMKALVTGASGFIGGNVVRELLKQGYQVRAMVRKESNQKYIQGMNIEVLYGDLLDKTSLDKALDGCDALFHVAAAYTFWTPEPKAIYEANVQGTENILTAAREKRVLKVVYTSTESTIGIGKDALGTETMETSLNKIPGHYKKSKFLAERLAFKMSQAGLPLVVVNPTAPVGQVYRDGCSRLRAAAAGVEERPSRPRQTLHRVRKPIHRARHNR